MNERIPAATLFLIARLGMAKQIHRQGGQNQAERNHREASANRQGGCQHAKSE